MEETPKHCEGKDAYDSEQEARSAITANSYFYKKPALDVYRCRECNLYHLTNRKNED